MPKGQMDIRILADGTIRLETGNMAGPAHRAADDFLKLVTELMGGEVETEKTKSEHHHHHGDEHEHEHHKH